MSETPAGDLSHPAAQIPISSSLVEQLGESVDDYAAALWRAAQHTHTDADEMAALIREANAAYGVNFPDTIIDKWQEIFRNSGGLVTIISEDRVLAGTFSEDADALEQPHASGGPSAEPRTGQQRNDT